MGADKLASACEIVKDKLYFAALRRPNSLTYSPLAHNSLCFSIDADLVYEPFFADFGPLNLGQSYRYCERLLALLKEAEGRADGAAPKRVYHCTSIDPHKKANAAVLIGVFSILYCDKTADEAYRPLLALKPYVPFRDASCGASTFHLTVLDCLRAVEKAKSCGFIDFHKPDGRFDVEEYEHYEQVENGDLNWIVPGKAIAFSGPSAKRTELYGYRTLVPEDYWDFYRKAGVTAIIRLNKKLYEKRRFQDAGFRHHDMYFPDGSCPTDAILRRFLDTVEKEPGVVCVHCKAGLGRTGVLLGSYIMKHYKFTASEVIGYLRICRPGSVIGPQQHYLRDVEAMMWRAGESFRQARLPEPSSAVEGPSPSGASDTFSASGLRSPVGVQRIVNAAGQPRKVAAANVPSGSYVGKTSPTGGVRGGPALTVGSPYGVRSLFGSTRRY